MRKGEGVAPTTGSCAIYQEQKAVVALRVNNILPLFYSLPSLLAYSTPLEASFKAVFLPKVVKLYRQVVKLCSQRGRFCLLFPPSLELRI